MRARQKLVIDRKTGDATVTTVALDDAADFATRVRELRESLPDLAGVEARFAAAVCDGCGDRAGLDFENPTLPPGWVATEAGDFCPGCQSLNLRRASPGRPRPPRQAGPRDRLPGDASLPCP